MTLTYLTPPLSLWSAHALAGFFALSYVGSLYLSKHTRLKFTKETPANHIDGKERAKYDGEKWRDDPEVIRARLLAVSVSTLLSCCVVFITVRGVHGIDASDAAFSSTAVRLGLTLSGDFSKVFPSCLIAPVLYLGPFYVGFLFKRLLFQERWNVKWSIYPIFLTWAGFRNIIAGPVTEEVVFRACILAVYQLAGSSSKKMIFLTPLWFGVAHLHHAWDTYNRFGRTSAAFMRAAIGTVAQLAYTTLFGFHCAYLFLRTGSLFPPILSHMFCNFMGLPGFGNDVALFPSRRYYIIFAYVVGLAGYIYTLPRWTDVPGSLYWLRPGDVPRY